jgi:V/A-type H+-transporting ATPase subunit F
MAIVGDGDSILVFKAAGVDTFPADSPKKAHEIVRKVAREYPVLFITEDLAAEISDLIKRFDEEAYPAILVIPSKNGSEGYGEQMLKDAMERALGVDILYNKEP